MKQFLQHTSSDFILFKEEQVEMVIRHHWITSFFIWIRWIFKGPLIVLSGFIFIFLIFPEILWTKGFFLMTYFSFVFLLFYSILTYIRWTDSIFDILIVTSDRVIDVSQIDFFHKNISETRISYIQDVKGNIQGFLNTFFNWGNISILTSSNTNSISMEDIENPSEKSRAIFSLVYKNKKSEKNREEKTENHLEKDSLNTSTFKAPFSQKIQEKITNILLNKK